MINSEEVTKNFMDCIFHAGEPIEGYVAVRGLQLTVGFHPTRLESKREFVKECIAQLHPNFTEGGGWSFLNLCEDKDGNQWTSFHKVMDELVMLSIGLKLASFPIPLECWSDLPGCMPYVAFKKD